MPDRISEMTLDQTPWNRAERRMIVTGVQPTLGGSEGKRTNFDRSAVGGRETTGTWRCLSEA